MILSDLNKIKIEDVIDGMKNEQFFALLLSDDSWALFISQEFLDNFVFSDSILVNGEELTPFWGKGLVDICLLNGGFAFIGEPKIYFEDHASFGCRIEDFGFRCRIDPNMGAAAAELKNALNFERYGKILAYTSAEVLKMGGEDE